MNDAASTLAFGSPTPAGRSKLDVPASAYREANALAGASSLYSAAEAPGSLADASGSTHFALLGLGTAVPEHAMTQAEAVELAHQIIRPSEDQSRWLKTLYRRAGVTRRYTIVPHREALEYLKQHPGDQQCGPTTRERMALYRQCSPELACRAAAQALERAAMPPGAITHLITVSCTGFAAPGVDWELIHSLGVRPTVERAHLGFMGCHGAINGLRVARGLARDPDANVLLCAVELCSLHYTFRWDAEGMMANALFSDGAAAAVGAMRPGPGLWRLAATGSCIFPESQEAIGWSIGDHGFDMRLSSQVPELIATNLRPWLEGWLKERGLCIADIASWAVHPGGPRVLTSVESGLGLARGALEASREVLAEYGNMSSPTVLFILERLRQRGAAGPCVALGFGPGLAAEAALFC